MSNEMAPEQEAEEWLDDPIITKNMRDVLIGAFLNGYDAGYARGCQIGKSRGKAEERQRIYKACVDSPRSMPPALIDIILGGNDDTTT